MSNKKGGKQSQLTGERAETKVRDALLDARFFCSKYENDKGEDLLVELEGYMEQTEAGSEPRIGLLQIKGHETETAPAIDDGIAKRRLDLNHLRRWAGIPLPVFVVAVDLLENEPLFYARSVDRIIGDVAPAGLEELEQQKITVSLPRAHDLPSFLKTEIARFYSLNAFQLSSLSENVIARNHYEVISSTIPFVPPLAKVWLKNIRVLWKV